MVTLGMEDDPLGAGYNVNQAKIAIGSGGLFGKGHLNGTQTKLKYVPEQHTDFIYCTIGEEQGFLGCTAVLVAFLILILRVIHIAERQPSVFGRVYGYWQPSRHGDWPLSGNRYSPPLLQLRRFVALELHHPAVHPAAHRRLAQTASLVHLSAAENNACPIRHHKKRFALQARVS